MRPPETFLGQPIRDLQTMLRVFQCARCHRSPVIPDGIYGRSTREAVADFQREHGLPPTGVADQKTFEAVVRAYEPVRTALIPACPLYIRLEPNSVIVPGQCSPHIYLVQAMLTVLSGVFPQVKAPGFSGILDPATETALRSFQSLCGLEPTGALDKITWKHLCLQYPLAAELGCPGTGKQP